MKKIYTNRDNLKKLLFIAHLFVACFAMAEQEPTVNTNFFKEPLTEYTKEGWKKRGKFNQGIRFFKDANGKDFVLKYQAPSIAIHDTLGAHIVNTLGVPANQVILLPAGSLFMGEPLQCTATLHTHVPGKEVFDIDDMPYHVDIENGLSTDTNLESITEHETLGNLVAAHVYLNKNDSHRNNLFFEKETNQFFAIDFGNIFHTAHELPNENNDTHSPYSEKNKFLHHVFPNAAIDLPTIFKRKRSDCLASEAHEFLQTLNTEDLSEQEIITLRNLDITLGEFTAEYPAAKIYDEWMNLADKAQYTYSPQKNECIKVLVEYNAHEVNRLRSELNRLTQKQLTVHFALKHMAEPGKMAQHDFWRTMNS